VKYRGIFINDEAPPSRDGRRRNLAALIIGVRKKCFELLLRLKANYPLARHVGNAFNDDDRSIPLLADRYG